MGRARVEKVIVSDYGEDVDYVCQQHPGLEGARLFPRVLKLLAGALGDVLDALDTKAIGAEATSAAAEAMNDGNDGPLSPKALLSRSGALGGNVSSLLDSDLDLGKLGGALEHLSDKLMADERLILDLLKYTRRRGPDDAGAQHVVDRFDSIYQGNYGELLQAVWFSLETNYGHAIRRRFFSNGGVA